MATALSHSSNGRTQAPARRSLSQDSAPVPPVPEKEKSKSKRSGKKTSNHADVIDRLDFSGVGPSTSPFLLPTKPLPVLQPDD